MAEQNENSQAQVISTIDETVEDLTAHFRRISRGRIIELPRWAQ